ncbi:MAG: hypothetical protein GY774_39515 [Planctomycetes bacterium]|nr:hypothetical protein [Planctomycetota bacterium]
MQQHIVFFVVAGFLLCACATVESRHMTLPDRPAKEEQVRFPPYKGPKRNIQVVEIRIPAEDVKRYPELSEKRVGYGLGSVLYDTLFDSDRFIFLEGKEKIMGRILKEWKATKLDIVVGKKEFELLPSDFLVYAKVFNFNECLRREKIGWTKELTCVTSVGVQVRIVKVDTRELIPGSSNPRSSRCTYINTRNLPLFGAPLTAFEESAVYEATLKAMRCAVRQVLERFDRKEW